MKRLSIIISSTVLVAVSSLFASYDDQVFIRGVRPMGMGGAFVALSDDQNAMFYNPAGLTQREGSQFTLFELPLNISDDIVQFYRFYQDNEDKMKDFDNLSDDDKIDLLNKINNNVIKYRPNIRTGLPNTSFLSGPGFLNWGFGIYNQEDIGFKFNRSLIVPNISFWGNADAVAAVPLAHRFDALPFSVPGKFSIGATVKYIYRAKIEELNKSVLEFEDFEPQLQYGKGLGFDVGTLYQPSDRWNVGVQVTDAGGTKISYDAVTAEESGEVDKPAYDSVIKTQWNAGAAYIPAKIYYWPGRYINTLDRLVFAADVRDIANEDETLLDATFFKKLHMGAELRWGPSSLRLGLGSGYPSCGLGLRVPYLGLKLDYAFWGEEMGRYAGQDPNWNHQLSIALSWGDSSGKAYGKSAAGKSTTVAKKKKTSPVEKKTVKTAAPAPAAVSAPAVSSTTASVLLPALQAGTTTVTTAVTDAVKDAKAAASSALTVPAQPTDAAKPSSEATTVPAAAVEQKTTESGIKGTEK